MTGLVDRSLSITGQICCTARKDGASPDCASGLSGPDTGPTSTVSPGATPPPLG